MSWRRQLCSKDTILAGTFNEPPGKDVVYKDAVRDGEVSASADHLAFRQGGGALIIDVDTKRAEDVEQLYPRQASLRQGQ